MLPFNTLMSCGLDLLKLNILRTHGLNFTRMTAMPRIENKLTGGLTEKQHCDIKHFN